MAPDSVQNIVVGTFAAITPSSHLLPNTTGFDEASALSTYSARRMIETNGGWAEHEDRCLTNNVEDTDVFGIVSTCNTVTLV